MLSLRLSYTSFEVHINGNTSNDNNNGGRGRGGGGGGGNLTLDNSKSSNSVSVSVAVTNTGGVTGDEVVMAYWRPTAYVHPVDASFMRLQVGGREQ